MPPHCCPLRPAPQWSSQPIYVLDKDNDLTVSQLALRNAVDMVRVQPEGPYLVGGHSYGGAGGCSSGLGWPGDLSWRGLFSRP